MGLPIQTDRLKPCVRLRPASPAVPSLQRLLHLGHACWWRGVAVLRLLRVCVLDRAALHWATCLPQRARGTCPAAIQCREYATGARRTEQCDPVVPSLQLLGS